MTNIDEIAATTAAVDRRMLLELCRDLLSAATCISPFNWIIEESIKAHRRSPGTFDWRRVNVELPAMERELVRQELFTDDLAQEWKILARSRERNVDILSYEGFRKRLLFNVTAATV